LSKQRGAIVAHQASGNPGLKLKVYPLRGFITYNDIELTVEKTRDGFLEVRAPYGKHLSPDILHTLVCDGMSDMRDRLRYSGLEACSEECR
jgi:hypothetical protein